MQQSGSVVIIGLFNQLNGTAIPALNQYGINIARLNSNGSLDSTFLPQLMQVSFHCLAVDGSGRLLVGGSSFSSIPFPGIVRLLPGGGLDQTFKIEAGADGDVSSITVQPDGRILLGGSFGHVNLYAWSSPHLNGEDTGLLGFVVLAMIKATTFWRGV